MELTTNAVTQFRGELEAVRGLVTSVRTELQDTVAALVRAHDERVAADVRRTDGLAQRCLADGNHARLTVGLLALVNSQHEHRRAWDSRLLTLWDRLGVATRALETALLPIVGGSVAPHPVNDDVDRLLEGPAPGRRGRTVGPDAVERAAKRLRLAPPDGEGGVDDPPPFPGLAAALREGARPGPEAGLTSAGQWRLWDTVIPPRGRSWGDGRG